MRRLLIALVTTLAFVFCAAPAMAKKQMSEHSAVTKSAKPKKAKPAPKAKPAAPAAKKAVPVPTKSKNGKKIARRERAKK